MSFYDWLIVIIPTILVVALACYCRRYVKGVADFLAAGRLCGRYVIIMNAFYPYSSVNIY